MLLTFIYCYMTKKKILRFSFNFFKGTLYIRNFSIEKSIKIHSKENSINFLVFYDLIKI